MAPLLLTLLIFFSPLAHAAWTPVEPKHDDPVVITPSVCMMYHFGTKGTEDPLNPYSYNSIVEGSDKNIYGAGDNGGCAKCYGMVFKMTPEGEFSIVHKFDGIEGNSPNAGLAKGNKEGSILYGTTYGGGRVDVQSITGDYKKYSKVGTIYSVSPGGGVSENLWSFRNGWLRKINCKVNVGCDPPHSDEEKRNAPPSYPYSPPVTNKAGHTMGVTPYAYNQRYGALYSLDGGYNTVETMDGAKALKLLSLSPGESDNNFYGTAAYGSKGNLHGVVFKTSGGGIEVIHEFNGVDGSGPTNVIQGKGKDKRLYGVTWAGGKYKMKHGVIYSMNADGSDYKVLHDLNGYEGSQPASALVFGWDGRLYGSAAYGGAGRSGILFRIDRDGKNFVVLHDFKMYVTGKAPLGNMIQHSNGKFYGTTYQGGRHNFGGIFQMDVGFKGRSIGPAGGRYCCSLGQGTFTSSPMELSQLAGHRYGTQKIGDPVGFVYTNRAGLLDIGHVRDMIDLTRFIYFWLMTSDRNDLKLKDFPDGTIRPIRLPMDQDEVLKIAGSMAYVLGWAHELITWKMYFWKMKSSPWVFNLYWYPQDFSSFSPEDLVSNLVGVEIGMRTIRENCGMDFDKAVDLQMERMMKELDAQPAARTKAVLDSVEGFRFGSKKGKWFTENATFESIWRRNFYANPWLVPYQNLGAYRPGWLNSKRFEPYYNYFDFYVGDSVNRENGIFIDDIHRKTEELRQEWEKDNPGMTRWP